MTDDIKGIVSERVISDLGEGMLLYKAELPKLREQDVNARILPPNDYAVMVNNIRRRGRLESAPYCALIDGVIEIVSGHHRIIAAQEAGIKEATILLDTREMSRSELIAKQLAHNRLAGFDDPETLKRLFEMLEEPEHMLETGMSNDMIELPDVDLESGLVPSFDIDWRVITLAFLPHQLDEFEQLMEAIPPSEVVGAVPKDQYEKFLDVANRFSRLKNVRNMGTVMSMMVQAALKELEAAEKEESENGEEGKPAD